MSAAEDVLLFLNQLPPERRTALARLRTLILRAAPGIDESMHHALVNYSRGDKVLFSLASEKTFLALYLPTESDVIAPHRERLTGVECGKSSLRFRSLADLPLDVVETIIRAIARPPRPEPPRRPSTRPAPGRPGPGKPGTGRPGAGRAGAAPGGRPARPRGRS